MLNSKIIILGSGTPIIDPKREGPTIAIEVNGKIYIFDAGRGIVRRAVQAGINPSQLNTIFFTHLHSDHTVGLPDLIFTTAVEERIELEIFGPRGTKNMIKHLIKAYKNDIIIRTKGLEKGNPQAYIPKVKEITSGFKYENQYISIENFLVSHGDWPCYGFKIVCPDKTIVISGDTKPTQSLIKAASNCDILIHEVYSTTALSKKNQSWQEYHKRMHTSSIELGQIAAKVNTKTLILYHQLYWTGNDDEIIGDIQKYYKGNVISARDLDIF